MIKNINTLVIVLFLFKTTLLLSQKNELRGLIIDSESKTPISGVNISIINSPTGTITNSDGKFILHISEKYNQSTMVFSFMGYKTAEYSIDSFINDKVILLNSSTTVLDEVIINISKNTLTANQIVQKAFDNYYKNFPVKPFIAKGFLRHLEKNKKEYKWLIESAITMYDNSDRYNKAKIKFHIDEIRRSNDLRSLDSLSLYQRYLIGAKNMGYKVFKRRIRQKIRDTVSIAELTKGIMYNDLKTNGLHKIFNGHKNIVKNRNNFDNGNQNILRNYGSLEAVFDKDIFKKHHFSLDTILLEGSRYVYKIKITPHPKMIDLNSVLKKNYAPVGWFYIYRDNYAIKELEYALIAASKTSKTRNSLIFNTPVHYKINLRYFEYNNKMYLNYFSCNVPKSINSPFKINSTGKFDKKFRSKEDIYYYTKQEVIFTEIITDTEVINQRLQKPWDDNLFKARPYNSTFWKNYNIFPETQEQQKMIQDLEKKANLKEQFLRKK